MQSLAGREDLAVCLFRCLEIADVFKRAVVCKAWSEAGFNLGLWTNYRIYADKGDKSKHGCNIHCISDVTILRLAARLREVARQAKETVLPRHVPRFQATDKVVDESSQMEVHVHRFDHIELWSIQFNTAHYGWFSHTSDISLGLKVWAPCLVLARYFCSPEAPTVVGRRCLELGAGNGLFSATLGVLGAHMTCTDIESSCLRISKLNVELNGVQKNTCVRRLEYGEEDARTFVEKHGQFECIFGADVLYVDRVAEMLFETADILLEQHGSFYLGYVHRHQHTRELLHSSARQAGFFWEGPRPLGKEQQPSEVDSGVAPAGLGGSLFEFRKQLRGMGARVQGEPEARVELYRFMRRGRFRLDTLD
eukprot:TRINITY_DN45167_c0_g1_i1.p1 TRINITY_DN45167_c0_g1~~TRINITY_DN45167_c0_g1_i1.p1  ORF type:complete len:365 (-),score=58.49 TRINITY_DN45167_c0_g1_i1:398-1492(-)